MYYGDAQKGIVSYTAQRPFFVTAFKDHAKIGDLAFLPCRQWDDSASFRREI